jgi:hypothetical protein
VGLKPSREEAQLKRNLSIKINQNNLKALKVPAKQWTTPGPNSIRFQHSELYTESLHIILAIA